MRVFGFGDHRAEIAIVGEAPGWQEDKTGRPFVGKTGDELDRLLDANNLPPRHKLWLTNLYREYQGKEYVYTSDDLVRDEPALLNELQDVHPHVIVTLGRHATRYFLGDVDMDSTEGIPWLLPAIDKLAFLGNAVIFPIIHPAAGLHNSKMSPYVVSGFQQLSCFLAGKLEPRILFNDPYPEPVYEEITTEAQLQFRLRGLQTGETLAIDTEGWTYNPWSLQFSCRAGSAYLIRAHRRDLLDTFSRTVCHTKPGLVFHSALHDLGMERALALTGLEELPFDDTAIMAYLLQLEPKGLKAGCLRHCNMKMSDYQDIVGDIGNELARDYLVWILDAEVADYEEKQQAEFIWQRDIEKRRISVLPKLPKTPLHKAVIRVLQSKRPRELWKDQIEDIQVAGYHRLGPLPGATLDHISPTVAIHYGCRDADGTQRLLPEYRKRIDAMGLRGVYELELGTYPLIDRMQRIGIKPDLEHFAELSKLLALEIQDLQEQLQQSTGLATPFNANSGDQVADYLFSILGLEELKMTKGGRGSTNDKILEALEHEHPEYPIISTIRTYRETYKLKHTFVDRLPDFVYRWPHDGRVHATFRTTRVVTGRLASSDPNMLAQPEHGKFAEEFKRGWVADAGHVLCQWDESMIELRGLAHLSQDPVMLNAFQKGTDLHAMTAERIFGVKPKDQDKHKHRLPAKAINFGIPMGMTCHGLSVELRKNGVDADEDTAQLWLDETLGLYQGVAAYMEQRKDEARRNGFVRCLSGRIRYIGGIRSRDDRIREEAERFAFSTPIQESATWIMKQAEATIWQEVLPYFWKRGQWVEPLLQVHDSLLFECEAKLACELHLLVKSAMTEVPKSFSVPLAVEGEYGKNRADMVPF